MTDFTNPSDRVLLRESMTDEEWARVKAAEPGGGGGPNSKYFSGAKRDFHLLGTDLFGEEIKQDAKGKLRELFDFPPFTILNAREGPWQERKRAWLACGIQSEVGRGENLLKMSDTVLEPDPEKRAAMQAARGDAMTFGSGGPGDLAAGFKARAYNDHEWQKRVLGHVQAPKTESASLDGLGIGTTTDPYRRPGEEVDGAGSTGTSIFDPVLCELMYRWFCPPGGLILDPFAGGSVRGIVAGLLGYRYYGIDLRPEQIAANEAQREMIAPEADIQWRVGDSNILLTDAPEADFVFSCPPYGDLEQYSDDPSDLSAVTWEQFVGIYRAIIRKAVARLKPNRFACFVVGEYRDKETGLYRGFVPLTCASFMAAGAALYNEAILITAVGSLPIRVTKQFETSRKLGKTHQNVIICVKGDPKIAAEAIRATSPSLTPQARQTTPRTAPLGPTLVETRSGSMADFLGLAPMRSTSDWKVQEPPELTGIKDIILNFATTGLDWAHGDRPAGVTVSTLDGQLCRFLPFAFQGDQNLDPEVVKRWLREQVRGKHILNSKTKFEMHMSREWGVDLEEQGNTFSDIQHTAALLDDHRKRFSLDILAKDYLPNESVVHRVDERHHTHYSATDVAEREIETARLVGKLRAIMYPQIKEQELEVVQQLENEVIPATVEMEKNGSPLDMELLERYNRECTEKHQQLMKEVSAEAGFSFEHTATGWQRLFEKCHLPPTDSVAEDVIGEIEHPLVKKAHFASQFASLNSKTFEAYKNHIDSNGLLRYDINQLMSEDGGTVSGRYSIGLVQQVPNADNHTATFGDDLFPRRLFIPGSGQYLEADAAQIEFRLLVHYSGNTRLLQAYKDDPWMSFHKTMQTMLQTYKPDMLYAHTKNYNFAAQYGARSIKLAVMMKFITKAEGEEIRSAKRWDDPRLKLIHEIESAYKRAHPEASELLDRASHLAKSSCDKFCKKDDALHRQYPHRGYVKTLLGRRSRFPTNYKTYIGLNRVLQGTGASIMKRKLTELHRVRKETGFVMRITNHDAVLGDATTPETLPKVKEILNRQSFELKVPILWSCGQGANWAEAH